MGRTNRNLLVSKLKVKHNFVMKALISKTLKKDFQYNKLYPIELVIQSIVYIRMLVDFLSRHKCS